MASQGERELGLLEMDEGVLESMVQDGIPVQDIPINVQEQYLPQLNPEPEMGAAAAAAFDTPPPPLLHQNPPPIPAETVHPGAFDMAQLVAILAGMENRMENKMNGMENRMEQTMREEMQCMGAGLQGGIEQLKKGNGERLRATCWATEERGRQYVVVRGL